MNSSKTSPPPLARWLLKRLLRYEYRCAVVGDFEEIYREILEEHDRRHALLWYWRQVFKSTPSFITNSFLWSAAMFKNYFKIAVRNLLKYKMFSFINISGLAVGMACCIVIFLFVQYELSYDKYHKNAKEIYRITNEQIGATTVNTTYFSSGWMAPNLINDFPGILDAVRIYYYRGTINHDNKRFSELFSFVDNSFLDIFTFPLVKGDKKTALLEPNTAVISEEYAQKYFGGDDPIGKVLTLDNKLDFTITGILKNIPYNSHLRYNLVVSYTSLKYILKPEDYEKGYNIVHTYLLLNKNASPEEIDDKLYDFVVKYKTESYAKISQYSLQPLTSIYLNSDLMIDRARTGDIVYSYLLSIIAFLILTIACVNFMNLSTARASLRAKEVGMRKVVGANRGQLIRQLLTESVFLSSIALIFAIVIAQLFLPLFNSLADKHLSLDFGKNQQLYVSMAVLVVTVGIFSGSYPGVFLASFNPVDTLKGGQKRSELTGVFIRKGLVIFQYTLSLVMIIGTFVILSQLDYISNKNLGFNKENVINITIQKSKSFSPRFEAFRNELLQNPNIIDVIPSGTTPGQYEGYPVSVQPEGFSKDEQFKFTRLEVSESFYDFYGIEIVAGRSFSPDISTDAMESVMLNETAVKKIGWDDPLGKEINVDFMGTGGKVIGIVKDFNAGSLHKGIEPTVFQINLFKLYIYVSVRIRPEDVQGTIAFLENKWNEYSPDTIFRYSFLNDVIAAQYEKEKKEIKIVAFSSILAIILASLGLFGLASFTAERRTKEIGIRRALGATVPGIVMLLSKDFAKLVLAANVIAWPVAYLIMDRWWLQNFAYKVNIGWWVFVLAGILTLAIALITISYQSIKAATANPIDSLRFE